MAAVVGHDFGSPVAAYCALVRPDVFRSVVLMSAPFSGPPALPFNSADDTSQKDDATGPDIHAALAALPRPRKHYQWYYSTREANEDMRNCPQGVHAFLRDYFHHKSADWKRNNPFPLAAWNAGELAKLPTYYAMDLDQDMPQTVARERPTEAQVAACKWLPDDELRVYSTEYARNGFQGGLQWYRCRTSGNYAAELQTYSGRTIDVPSCFIAGTSDWGTYQAPGDFEKMQNEACAQMRGCHLVDGAGHSAGEPGIVSALELIAQFLQHGRSPA